mgnify:CR=1 FL=1
MPHESGGEHPRETDADQDKAVGSEQQARIGKGVDAKTDARTEIPQPKEAEKQKQEEQQQNEDPLVPLDQSILDILVED